MSQTPRSKFAPTFLTSLQRPPTISNQGYIPPPRPESSFLQDINQETGTFEEGDTEDFEDIIQETEKINFVDRVQLNAAEKKFQRIMNRLKYEEKKLTIPAIVNKIQTINFFGDEYFPSTSYDHQFVGPIGSQLNTFILFGGKGEINGAEVYNNNLHLLDLKRRKWQLEAKKKEENDSTWPKSRAIHTMTVNLVDLKTIWMFGGQFRFGKKCNELWTLTIEDKVKWNQIVPSNKNINEIIPPISHHTCIYYHSNLDEQIIRLQKESVANPGKAKSIPKLPMEHLVIYGGDIGSTTKIPQPDTWIFDITTLKWEKMKTKLVPFIDPNDPHSEPIYYSESRKDSPPPRTEHSAILYQGGKMVIFGGIDMNQKQFNDTWILNIHRQEWMYLPTYLIRGLKPTPRARHSAVISGRDMFVSFGGLPFSNSIFRLDLETRRWSELELYNYAPRPRMGSSILLLKTISQEDEEYGEDILNLYRKENELRQYLSEKDFIDADEEDDEDDTPKSKRRSKYYRQCKLLIYGGTTFDPRQGSRELFNDLYEVEVGRFPDILRSPQSSIQDQQENYLNGRIWSISEIKKFEEGLQVCGEDWERISREFVTTRNPSQIRNFAITKEHSFKNTIQSRKSKMKFGRWTNEEHNLFLEALNDYGQDFEMIAKKIKTRNVSQVRMKFHQYMNARTTLPDSDNFLM